MVRTPMIRTQMIRTQMVGKTRARYLGSNCYWVGVGAIKSASQILGEPG
jgi:hypothetical protein